MNTDLKRCGYPKCTKKAASRGKLAVGGSKRFKWCRYHRNGNGKAERLVYAETLIKEVENG